MNMGEHVSFFNGEPTKAIPINDRGFNYGHGLFETMKLAEGLVPLWRYHLSRLTHGAAQLGLSIDIGLLHDYLSQLIEHCPVSGVIKIILTAGEGGRGYFRQPEAKPNYLLQWFDLPDYPSHYRQEGVTLKLCQHSLSYSPNFAGIKHLNRLDQVIARMEWADEYPEGLMLDQQQQVVEGVSRNLFFYSDAQWFTPKIDQCGVAGVMRQYLMEQIIPSCEYSVEETTCPLERLRSAEEVLVCNSVTGIWPVLALETYGSWSLGQHTLRLQRALNKALPCYE